MNLYPLRFEPIFKSMLWGGHRLPGLVRRPAPTADPIGEAWVLSDVDGNLSAISNGPLAGRTLREVVAGAPRGVFGDQVPADGRFPLLLKFIDAKTRLSVQVHPNDEQAVRLKGAGSRGKTEAWVILDANPSTSTIYAGLHPGVTAAGLRDALDRGAVHETLHSFAPKAGDCVLLDAGSIHAIGADILLFEVQQTSDITYRLSDWGRVDAKTGKPRELHIDAGLACTDLARGPVDPVTPVWDGDREQLVRCPYFSLHRITSDRRFTVGKPGECRVLVVLDADGRSEIEWAEDVDAIATGDVLLVPAAVGSCSILPAGSVTLLECGI